MRIPPMAQVCSELLCGSLILIAGCGNPPPQTLASLTVTATPSTLSIGGAAILRAVAHLSDGTTQDVTAGTQWTLSNPSLAGISNGALTATAAGTVIVQAAYAEAAPAGNSPASADTPPAILSASSQVTITATPSTNTPSLTWNAPAAITYGVALSSTQLNATSNVPGAFAYSPAAGTVLKAGTQTLSLVFTPTETATFSSATATVKLVVTQAAPVITWPAPAAITQGTPLSSLQLDASATVPGSFIYNPAAGSVLASGTVPLSASFTPIDTTDYSSAAAHNTLIVAASLASSTSSAPFGYTGSPVVSTFAPPNPATAISSNFFGMTIEHTFTPFPSFPVSTQRFWDVDPWQVVEPSDGEFVWTGMDASIALGQEKGVRDFIYTFGNVPAWASTNPSQSCDDGPGTCAPPDMAAFDDFATQVVQRYCGKIKYYETWNEPNDQGYWSGTNAQLMTVAQHLYQIAKDPANCGCANGVCGPNSGSNPNQVLMPPISRVASYSLSWLDSYLSSAGAPYTYADVAAFHGYGATNPEEIVSQVQSLNQILAKHGMSNLQLWNTEANWGSLPVVGQTQASWLMRYHVALATTGVSRFVWYAYDNCSWGTLWEGYCPNPQMPIEHVTEGGEAYAVIESWLSGANLDSCQVYQNGLWACELQRPAGYQAWILWSSTGAQISVPIAEDFGLTVYRDWQNNVNTLPAELSVDQMPVLLENHDL